MIQIQQSQSTVSKSLIRTYFYDNVLSSQWYLKLDNKNGLKRYVTGISLNIFVNIKHFVGKPDLKTLTMSLQFLVTSYITVLAKSDFQIGSPLTFRDLSIFKWSKPKSWKMEWGQHFLKRKS